MGATINTLDYAQGPTARVKRAIAARQRGVLIIDVADRTPSAGDSTHGAEGDLTLIGDCVYRVGRLERQPKPGPMCPLVYQIPSVAAIGTLIDDIRSRPGSGINDRRRQGMDQQCMNLHDRHPRANIRRRIYLRPVSPAIY